MALPVPIPGISVLFGVPLIIISAQFALGYRRAWLPARLAQRSVSRAGFLAIVDPYAAAVAAARAHSAAACWVAGRPLDEGAGWHHLPGAGNHQIIITLPVPLGHVMPGTAISVLALGLIEGDGVAIAPGIVTAVLGLAVVVIASADLLNSARLWQG
jgi:hypothetical protein